MKADFFRMLFRGTPKGICVTLSMKDEVRAETLHAAYIGAEATPALEDTYPLDILAVGDLMPETLRLMEHMIERREIHTVVLPGEEGRRQAEEFCTRHGVQEVLAVKDALIVKKERWELLFWTFPGACGETLVLLQRFVGADPAKEDCVLTGKFMRGEPCVPCIYGDDDYCGFGCLCGKDFDVLKGHKRKGSTGYRMGVLILGTARLHGRMDTLMEMAGEFRDELRCICLPWGMDEETCDDRLLELAPEKDYMYLIGPGTQETALVGRYTGARPNLQYRAVGGGCGFCISGYRIPYLRK